MIQIHTDQVPTDLVKFIQQQISDQLNGKSTWLSKAILPALATLIPTGIIAAFKWAQDHTHSRRSVQLTQRISELAKSISELPVISLSNANAAVTPQSALTAELESALRELTAIQVKESHHPRSVSVLATVTTKLRAILLLYRPKGFAAWALHLTFYAYSIFMFFVLVAVVSDQTTPFFNTQSLSTFIPDLLAFLCVFGIVGIPPVILRYFAARIHRKQCAAMQPAVSPESPQVPVYEQAI
jgi:hypothetical protein